VGLFKTKVEFLNLRVSNNAYNRAKLGNAVELMFNLFSSIGSVLLSIFGVGLLLALVPVLVATALELFGKMLRENGSKRAKTTRSLNVSYDTNNNHGRSLKNGDCVYNLTLVHECSGAIYSAHNVGHTSLVTTEGSEVRRCRGIILGKGADSSRVVLGALLGEEPKVSTTGSFELAMRHFVFVLSAWSI
jgi:hypothetical protein